MNLHSPLPQDPTSSASGEADKAIAAVALPAPGEAQRLDWTPELARSRGIYGFDSLDPRSRPFNMIRAKLLELRVERGWRLFGIVSATPNVGKSFIAANVAKQHKRGTTNLALAPDTAYDKAFRNAARADNLLQRHAYVLTFDDVAATNAVPLSRKYR